MIELLVSLLLPLTIILSLLLTFHKTLLKRLGANSTYYLWLCVPLGLITYMFPTSWLTQTVPVNVHISTFVVNSTHTLQHSFNSIIFVYIWTLFSSLFASYWFLSYLQFYKKLSITKYPRLTLDVVIPKNLTVYQSNQAYSPMLIGLVKQKLVLPENFTNIYSQEQQSLILEHEICHFDRNDIYWNLIAFVLLAVFWFHPLAWLAYFRFRRDQELSCDHTVLARKHLNSRINYSKALLVTAEKAPPIAFAQLSFKKYGDKEIMFERIKQIQSHTKTSRLSLATITLGTITLLSSMSYAGNMGTSASALKHSEVKIKPIVRIEPEYPYHAAKGKISGAVLLKFDIKPNGHTENITVIKAQPEGVFDNVALTALSHWKYEGNNNKTVKNNMVQLDFAFDENAEKVNLIEGIKIIK